MTRQTAVLTAFLFFLTVFLLLPAPAARADTMDSITSEPLTPAPDPGIPFFGDPVVIPGETPPPENSEQAATKPRPRSNRLEIPQDAARNNDLSFLEGCWYFEKKALHYDRPGAPFAGVVQDRFCFNKHGRGRFTERYTQTGKEYGTSATARFSKGKLVLSHPAFRDNDGHRLSESYTCSGRNAGTICQTYASGARYLSKQGTIRLTRTP